MDRKVTSYVATCTPEQIQALELLLRDRGWDFTPLQYTHWKCSGPKINIVAYLSGKVTIQGANTGEFVEFTLEPEILKTFTFGDAPADAPELDSAPHGGIDESGKGDFFGPLVVAGVCVDETTAPLLAQIGVCDSKLIKSAQRIRQLATQIRAAVPGRYSVLALKPATYNDLYDKIGNLNRLLAWGHARIIENLLELVPDCPRMLSDKFADESLIRRALMERGRQIRLDQQTKAESNVAVAAASILARDKFVYLMDELSKEFGVELPKGVSPRVESAGREIVAKFGAEALRRCAKTHFTTCAKVTGGEAAHDPDMSIR